MEPAPQTDVPDPVPRPGLQLRILYADDIRELREYVQITLSRLGHTVSCAADGAEAFALVAPDPHAFDLIITDHQMPVMDGLEFVQHLRTIPYTGRVIVFSGNLTPPIEAAYQKLAVDRIIRKPILPSTLPNAIESLYASQGELKA